MYLLSYVCFFVLLLIHKSSCKTEQFPFSPEVQQFCDKLFDDVDSHEDVSTLSASQSRDYKTSLTQGGSSYEGYKLHENAITMLRAVNKVMKSNFSDYTKNLVMTNYYVPQHYCPKHDYKYYRCDYKYPYRKIDGSCNNLYVPWWGKDTTPYERILKPAYDDGYDKLRTKSVVNGYYLPNPRAVAKVIHSARRTFPATTQLMVFFGQHIDHDMVLTHRATYRDGDEKECGCDTTDKDCAPIPVPADDYYNKDQKCLPFTRSSAAMKDFDCRLSYREQLNLQTHWLDLSNIYGHTHRTSKKLRSFYGGLLRTSINPVNGHSDLPFKSGTRCPMAKDITETCFRKGDKRGEDNHYLYVFNKMFVTEHNRIAYELAKLNPQWDDEKLYQEARKINIAEYQHIIYDQYLPMLLGRDAMTKWSLDPGNFVYNSKISPQVKASFAAAAGRYGHVLVNKFHYVYNNHYDLVDNYTTNYVLFSHTNYGDYILRGLLLQNSYYFTPGINEYLNNYLFQGMSKLFKRTSLGALNIQRGRDHGLPSYTKFRVWCGIDSTEATTFNDLKEIPESVRQQLEKLYYHVQDIDLFTGSMSEYGVDNGVVGPTTACILGEGFHTWKFGDRFYYENTDPVTGFTSDQLTEIKKASLARVICDNSDMYMIQSNPFLEAKSGSNDVVDCSTIAKVDLSKWKSNDYY